VPANGRGFGAAFGSSGASCGASFAGVVPVPMEMAGCEVVAGALPSAGAVAGAAVSEPVPEPSVCATSEPIPEAWATSFGFSAVGVFGAGVAGGAAGGDRRHRETDEQRRQTDATLHSEAPENVEREAWVRDVCK
jgi:hypothetical protein